VLVNNDMLGASLTVHSVVAVPCDPPTPKLVRRLDVNGHPRDYIHLSFHSSIDNIY